MFSWRGIRTISFRWTGSRPDAALGRKPSRIVLHTKDPVEGPARFAALLETWVEPGPGDDRAAAAFARVLDDAAVAWAKVRPIRITQR